MAKIHLILSLTLIFIFICNGVARTAEEWKSRTIYQILTDRFAKDPSTPDPCDLSKYCGGSFLGILSQLDYIQGLGFDAIWISPVITNSPGTTPILTYIHTCRRGWSDLVLILVDGYHGYWAQDFFSINRHFGTKEDLLQLVDECHKRNIWVMVDVVLNHVAPVGFDYSSINPFNDPIYYHDCSPCPHNCMINFDLNNQTQIELCRLAGLPDLDQSNRVVSNTLLKWIQELVQAYKLDGLRVDTVPEVSRSFWGPFQSAAGVFAIGEVFNGDVGYVSKYQGKDALNSVFAYPLAFTLRNCFAYRQPFYQLELMLTQFKSKFSDLSVLGTFFDNHDIERFLFLKYDRMLLQNILTYTIAAQGIPVVYYGTEQNFDGGSDPANREPLWPTDYDNSTDTYQVISKLISYRKRLQLHNFDQVQSFSDDTFYAFSRGSVAFVAMTNGGSAQSQIMRTITYHPFKDGTKLCNIFWGDCVVVTNGKFDVYLDHGESKAYEVSS